MRPLVLEPGFHLLSTTRARGDVAGRSYELLCVLARGGSAMVWLARTKDARGGEQLVAVKTILPEHAKNEKLQRLIVEEAQITSAITDRYVVRVIDVGQQGEVAFLVMELVDGESLRALHHVLEKRELRFPVAVALRIAADICAGLAAAHTVRGADGRPLGIIHRDVSPENVLLGVNGDARLIDFGIAKARSRAPKDTTAVGIAGKPDFLAPEVALGIEADVRADLWSAGALLYFMLAGRPPHGGASALATLHALASYAPIAPLPSSVPEATRAVVMQALQHDRDKRFTRAAAMHTAVEEAASASGGMASHDDVGVFLAATLRDRIAGRRKAIERALAESARRVEVHASLMRPPEIQPAGEQTTPVRDREAREAAALSTAIPSSDGATRHWEAPHVETLIPPATQPFPPMPTTTMVAGTGSSTHTLPFPAEQGTRPYQLRPPSRPPRAAATQTASSPPRTGASAPPPTPPPPRVQSVSDFEAAPDTQAMPHAPRLPSDPTVRTAAPPVNGAFTALSADHFATNPLHAPLPAPADRGHLSVQPVSQMPPVITQAGGSHTSAPPPYVHGLHALHGVHDVAVPRQPHLNVMHPGMAATPPPPISSSVQIATIPPMRGSYGSLAAADSGEMPVVPMSGASGTRNFVRVAIAGVAVVILLLSFLKYRADHARPAVAAVAPPAPPPQDSSAVVNATPSATIPATTPITPSGGEGANAANGDPAEGRAAQTAGTTPSITSRPAVIVGSSHTGSGRRAGPHAPATSRGANEPPATAAPTPTTASAPPPPAPRKNEDYGF